jgi:hypothetical protein
MKLVLSTLLSCACLAGCVGTTGGELLELQAYAAGPRDAQPDLRFTSSLGYAVTLREARIFVGGVFLNRSRPTSVASDTSCTLPGIYVAEILRGREVDLLSPAPQAFPDTGYATTDQALTGEVWLSQGDVNQTASSAVVLRVSGSAERGGVDFPFRGKLSIGQNRVIAPEAASLPGQHPICKQRIVSPIAVNLAPKPGAALMLRIDPRAMFANVDFRTLDQIDDEYVFADQTGENQASDNLYAGLRRSGGVYELSWIEERQ